MKTDHNSDPLDQKIDALLASRPLQPSDDFAARVMAATDTNAKQQGSSKRPIGKIIAFALPLAAAVALTFSLLQVQSDPTGNSTAALTTEEAQEIFLLEESLSSLAALTSTDFATDDLINTLDVLTLEI